MAYTQLKSRHTRGARVEEISRESAHYRLFIPSGFSDSYRLAQLDDYTLFSRGRFPHRNSLSLSLSVRTSSDAIAGTWGFGLWNDPFGLSLGFGGNSFRLPALPNAAWFFGASKENYLSFRDIPCLERSEAQSKDKLPIRSQLQTGIHASTTPPTNGGSAQRGIAANGFIAQTFRAPKFHLRLLLAGLALPFSRKTTRRILSQVIGEDGIALSADPTQWHRYRLVWNPKRVKFEVDDIQAFESLVSPNPPLGLVIWIDNQFAAFTPEGKIGFGVLENPEPAWLEVKEIELKSL